MVNILNKANINLSNEIKNILTQRFKTKTATK